jgi:hypothetical protein
MAYHEPGQRQGFNTKLRAEAEALLADAVFQRSPVLSKLLRYLVEETVAGRSGELKSFVVAVDGLGRSENFDATSDSSARVQMVRLRKTLENHYAQHGPVDELCIYLQPGSYTVRLGRLPTAYPTLYRPLSDAAPPPAAILPEPLVALSETPPPPVSPVTVAEMQSTPSAPSKAGYGWAALIVAFLMMAAALTAFVGWRQLGPTKAPELSPILELMPVESSNRPELEQTVRLVSSTFASDLPRFKLSRIRVVNEAEALRLTGNPENTYRLFSRLEDSAEKGLMLYLNLDDAYTDTSIWSREVRLPAGEGGMFDALIPVLGEINGPMGIISMHGNIVHRENKSGGYPCMLKYFEFVRTRERAIEDRVAACFEKPVKEKRIEATILAARSLFAIERKESYIDFASATKKAIAFARAAVEADPTDGSANFALARMSYLAGDCVSARFYTDRTLELNPYSPMFMTTLAGISNMCGYPDGAKLLDQAFLTQSPQFAKGRLMLILGALGQDRPDRIAEIGPSDLPQTRYNRINYYLSETLIAAAQGRRADAVRYWKLYSDAIPPGSRTANDKLRDIVALPAIRRKLIAFLVKAGVIGPSD